MRTATIGFLIIAGLMAMSTPRYEESGATVFVVLACFTGVFWVAGALGRSLDNVGKSKKK